MQILELEDLLGKEDVELIEQERYKNELKVLDINKLTLTERFLRNLSYVSLFIYGLDPFSVYKRDFNCSKTHFKFYRLRELYIKLNRWDYFMPKYRSIANIWLSYYIIKSFLLCLTQLLNHKNEDSYFTYILGNPLAANKRAFIYFCSSVAFSVAQSLIWLPHYYNTKPIDAMHFRLLPDPAREIKRLDLMILAKTNDFIHMISLKNFKLKSRINCPRLEHREIRINLELIEIVKVLKRNFWTMRPALYNPSFVPVIYRIVGLATLFIFAVAAPWLIFLPYIMFFYLRWLRCATLELNSCNLTEVYNIPELITSIEIVIGIIALGYFFSLQFVWMLSDMFSQLYSTNVDLDAELKLCLNSIRRLNSNEDVRREEETYVATLLMKNLIKLTIFHEDAKKNSHFLSIMVTSFLMTVGYPLILGIVGGRVGGSEMNTFRYVMISWLLFVTNCITLTCAHHYAKSAKIEQTAYFILAQLAIRTERLNISGNDFLGVGWTKLVTSECLSNSSHAVRLFDTVSIDFKRNIRLNFILVSFAAILKTV